jgi:hypothetical protein
LTKLKGYDIMPGEKEVVEAGANASGQVGNGVAPPTPDGSQTDAMGGPPSPEGLPEGVSLQDYVASEVKKTIEKYEGPEGDIAKAKSAAAKRVSEAERKLHERQGADFQQAQAIMEENPAQAAQMLSQQVESMQAQGRIDKAGQEWHGWVESEYKDAGLSTSEYATEIQTAADELLAQAMQGGGEAIALDWQKDFNAKQMAKKDKAMKTLEESIPGMITSEVMSAIIKAGLAPDPATGTAGPPKDETPEWQSWDADVQIRHGIDEARKKMAPAKELTAKE